MGDNFLGFNKKPARGTLNISNKEYAIVALNSICKFLHSFELIYETKKSGNCSYKMNSNISMACPIQELLRKWYFIEHVYSQIDKKTLISKIFENRI